MADILTSFIDTDERLPELVASAAMATTAAEEATRDRLYAMDTTEVKVTTETTSEDSDTVWLR